MQVLNYYKTLNNNRNVSDDQKRLYIETLDSRHLKEYKGLYMYYSYIIKDNIIITELVKPSKEWIDNYLNKGDNLCEGKRYFNYDRPSECLKHAKNLLSLQNIKL